VPVPELTGRVIDTATVFSTEVKDFLSGRLAQLEKEKGTQLVVLTVPTLEGEAIEPFLYRVAASWKIGRSKIDDGIIVLLVPNDRSVRIEVGRGLEGAVPDVYAKRIIEDIMIPYLKKGDYGGAVMSGVLAIEKLVRGEELPLPDNKTGNFGTNGQIVVFFVLMGVILFQILAGLIGQGFASLASATLFGVLGLLTISFVTGLVIFLAILFFSIFNSSAGGGSFRRSRHGGFSIDHSGIGFGDKFGGFSGGGGSFSGGGASGKW
jgi:uncharacterized protein